MLVVLRFLALELISEPHKGSPDTRSRKRIGAVPKDIAAQQAPPTSEINTGGGGSGHMPASLQCLCSGAALVQTVALDLTKNAYRAIAYKSRTPPVVALQ